jgi:RHS repeat-associated protein
MIVSVALLGQWFAPPSAQAQPSTTATGASTSERPDTVSASLTARSSGKRIEDLSQRTEESQVFANPDGTWTMESFAAPKFTQAADGSWSPLNRDLVQSVDGGLIAAVSDGEVLVSDGTKAVKGTAELARINGRGPSGKAVSLGLGWQGDLPKPAVKGHSARFAGAASKAVAGTKGVSALVADADVVVTATRDGFSHSVVINKRPTDPAEFRFPLTLTAGLNATIVPDTGAIEIRDASKELAFIAPKPMMWDSRTNSHSGLPEKNVPVGARIERSGNTQTLVLTADAAFLQAKDTVYPVTVDPTWTTGASQSTWIQTDATSPQTGTNELRVGTFDAGVHKARSLVQFPTSTITGKKIISASVQLYNYWSYSCTPYNIYAQRVTSAWNANTVVWSNQPTVTTTDQIFVAPAKGFSSACAAGNAIFDVTAIAQTWSDFATSNYGLRFVSGGGESDSNSWRRYWSSNYASGDNALEPHLTVTYNSYPNTAAAGADSSGQSVLWTDPVSGAQTRYTKTRKPTLAAVVSDPDGGTVKGLWTLTTGATKTWNQIAGTTVASGGTSKFTPVTATPALTEGSVYTMDVWANDGSLTSKSALRQTTFTVDSTAPVVPTVTASALTNGQWATPKPASNTFTFTDSSTDTVKFQYSKDGGAFVNVTASGSPAKATLSWVADGSHSLVVRALDKASNISSTATFTYGAGAASMTTPINQAKSTDFFVIKAAAPTASTGTVTPTIYWRAAGGTEPADFSPTNGSKTGWTAADTLPAIATGTPVNVNYKWSAADAAKALGKDRVPVLLDVQTCFTYTSPALVRCTHTGDAATNISVRKLPHAFGQGFPTSQTASGQVALWTGEYNTSSTDASVSAGGTGLSVSRSYSSLAGVDANSVFGPGWGASFDTTGSGDAGMDVYDETLIDGTIALVGDDGDALIYRQPGNGRIQDKAGVYTPVGADTAQAGQRVELIGSGTAARLQITDTDGTVTIFSPLSYTAGTPTEWAPLQVTEPGNIGTTSFTRDSQGRITRILAPVPAGITCPATGTLNPGCRALRISYATATTATSGTAGDITGQVKDVWFDAYNPTKTGGAGMDSVKIAAYQYNSAKQLVTVTDTRANRSTSYAYTGTSGSGAPLLTRITPPGEAAYTLSYGAASPDSQALLAVSRDNPSGAGAAIQADRFVYGINPSTATAGLPALTPADVALWDQSAAPTYGAAVFSADKPVNSSDPAKIAAGDWKYASLNYTDAEGYTVNTAAFGAGAWQMNATDYQNGNVIRAFTPGAIDAIRQAAASQGILIGETLGTSDQFATITRYNTESKAMNAMTLTDGRVINAGTILTAAGAQTTDTWTPVKPTGVDGEPARAHVHIDYDQGAPTQGVDLTTGQQFNLATTTTITSASAETGSPDPSIPLVTGEPVVGKTTQGYNPIDGASTTGPTSGWTHGTATTTTTVMPNPADNLTKKIRLDAQGRTVESRQPLSTGTDAGTTLSVYYTAAANTNGNPTCGSKPFWDGSICRSYTAEPTSTKPDTITTGYTMFLDDTQSVESLGSTTRTTDTTYATDGQPNTVTIKATGLPGSTPVSTTQNLYDPLTGRQTATAALTEAGVESGRTSNSYDKWGRSTSYTNASGETTTTSYTTTGAPSVVATPYGTTTYTYDGTDSNGKEERRGKPVSMQITEGGQAGSNGIYTASYNAAGDLIVQNMPAGLSQNREYDQAGQMTGLTYSGKTLIDGTSGNGPWISWSQARDVLGRVLNESTPDGIVLAENASGYARDYNYDQAGRLVRVQDRTTTPGTELQTTPGTDPATEPATPCQARTYTFDANGNRNSLATGMSGNDGACPTTPAPTKTWSYDAADRVQQGANNTGNYSYDSFGRQTTIPSIDTPNSTGDLAISYFDNDAARTITQDGTTTTFTLDPEGRRAAATTGSTTQTNGYSGTSDNPSWVSATTGTTVATTRYEKSLGGDLGISITGSGSGAEVKIPLQNPHQDTVATITLPATGDATGIDSWANYDEYGNQTGTRTNTGPTHYGWVGANQRATDNTGLLLMGARLYNPITGLFTSVDPVDGGNTTDYAYPQDPINKYDLDGNAWVLALVPVLILVLALVLGIFYYYWWYQTYITRQWTFQWTWQWAYQWRWTWVDAIYSGPWQSHDNSGAKNSDRKGHTGGKNNDKHTKAQGHGGKNKLPPNPNTARKRNQTKGQR